MDQNSAFVTADYLSKNPWLIPLFLTVVLLFMAFVLQLFSKSLEKGVIKNVDKRLDIFQKRLDKMDFVCESESDYRYLLEHIEIFKKTIDNNLIISNGATYKKIVDEITDLNNRFIKNFNNGSSIDRALQENSICQENLLTMLNGAMIKQVDRRAIATLIEFICFEVAKLIEGIKILPDAQNKLSLVSVYFNNLKVLISYFYLKEIDYFNLSNKELTARLEYDFNKLISNLTMKKESIIDEL